MDGDDDDDDEDDEGSMMMRRRRRGGAPRVVARLTVPAAGDGAPSEEDEDDAEDDEDDAEDALGETTLRLLTAARGTGSRRGMTRAAAVFSSTSFLSVIMPYPLAESVVFADDDVRGVRGVRGAPPAPPALVVVVPTTSR
jgi:hypothetical protein